MEIKDFKFNTRPDVLCQSLLAISGKFKLHDGPMGICIGTAIDPREFDQTVLKDLLKAIDQLVLPKAQEMTKEVARVDINLMSEIILLAFSDVVSSLREYHGIPPEIPNIPLLKIVSR